MKLPLVASALLLLDAAVVVEPRSLLRAGGIESSHNVDGGLSVDGRSLMMMNLPLPCNAAIDTAPCTTPFSSLLSNAETSPVVIPCGLCVTVDETSGGTVHVPHGLDVLGKLVFPSSASLVLNTTAVFVQGELSMNVPDPGKKVKVSLFGTQDKYLYPAMKCGGEGTGSSFDPDCPDKKNMSKKPIVVAGGKLDVKAIDPTCPSWTTLRSVNVLPPNEPPSSCGGALLEGDGTFASGSVVGFYNIAGSASSFEVLAETDGNSYLHQGGRSAHSVGVGFSVDESCAVEGRSYQFALKYRATSSSGTTLEGDYPLIGMMSWEKSDGSGWGHQHFIFCEDLIAAPGEWSSTCLSREMYFDAEKATATQITVSLQPSFNDVSMDIDYDDIAFDVLPPADNVDSLVVSKEFGRCVKPGEEILVTSDSIGGHDKETVAMIASVSIEDVADSATLDFVGSMFKTFPTEADGNGYAVEVARLNRDVIFEAQNDDADDLHGGHLMINHTPDVPQTLEGVEIRNFGQQGILGRYPIHFHMCGSVAGSIVSKNVIRDSNQRCVVVHGSHDARVVDNVAYDTAGHCYILEDGAEVGNTFERNLGARTKNQGRTIGTTDHLASTFWITNANNHYSGNVAAGSMFAGYWFETRSEVAGSSAMMAMYADVIPRTTKLYTFKDNVAHSNGDMGVRTYSPGWQPSELAVFENLRSYKNQHSGLFVHGSGNIAVKNSHFADNKICVDSFGIQAYKTYLQNSVCVGLSDDARARLPAVCRPIGVQYSYNERPWGQMELENVMFKGFADQGENCEAMVVKPESQNSFEPVTSGVFKAKGLSVDSFDSHPDITCAAVDSTGVLDVHLEDLDGTLKPGPGSTSAGGFYVQDSPSATAFLSSPGSSCAPVPRSGSCALYCPGVCLRMLNVYPKHYGVEKLVVSDGVTSFTFDKSTSLYDPTFYDNDFFRILLPNGNYDAHFEDAAGGMVYPDDAELKLMEAPLCPDHVKESSISLLTAPTAAPSAAPTWNNIDFEPLSGCVKGDGTFSHGTTRGFEENHGSSVLSIVDDESDPTNKILSRTSRTVSNGNDFKVVLDPNCLEEGVMVFTMKHRPHGQGPAGEGSTIIGMMSWLKSDGSGTWAHQHVLFCFDPVFANEWAECTGQVVINAEKASALQAQITFGYRESWATFDVDYDDISFRAPPPTTTTTTTTIDFYPYSGCIQGDGTFSLGTTEGFTNNHGSSLFSIVDDETDPDNKLLSRTERTRAGSDFKVVLNTECLEEGAVMVFHMKQRPHGQGPAGQGSTIIGMMSWEKADGSGWGHKHILFCFDPVFAMEWAECTGQVTLDAEKASAVRAQISFGYMEPWATFDVDYDDISFRPLV